MLSTIPGIGLLLGLTIAAEIGDVARFASPRKLIGYSGLAPRVKQSGQRSRSGDVLSREQPFKPRHPKPNRSRPAQLPPLSGRLTARTRIVKPGQLLIEMVRQRAPKEK